MKKYQIEFKLEVVRSFLAGEGGATLLARRWLLPKDKIRIWVSHYRLQVFDSLSPKRSAYSSKLKLLVMSHQDCERLSSRQVAAVYDIRNTDEVVVVRRHNLDEFGMEGLGSRKQGRSNMKQKRRHHAPPDPAITDLAQTGLPPVSRTVCLAH